jgi:hypothetical protein
MVGITAVEAADAGVARLAMLGITVKSRISTIAIDAFFIFIEFFFLNFYV